MGAYYKAILDNPSPYPAEQTLDPPTSARAENLSEGQKPLRTVPRGSQSNNSYPKEDSTTETAKPKSEDHDNEHAQNFSTGVAASKPRITFSRSLSGPAERAERLSRLHTETQLIGGVLVPPKPEEPDNCCMSGCVDCVWERYREEMEEWAFKSQEAQAKVRAQEGQAAVEANSMDDDGGGSETNWASPKIAKNLWEDDVFKDIPVEIREFMKQEKRLKEKRDLGL